ncbi:Lipoyl Synthase [Manis pentadactyla]|nr:Lipoyl Synthase [Manis pentadactyla]
MAKSTEDSPGSRERTPPRNSRKKSVGRRDKQEGMNTTELNCSTGRCYLAECWNGTEYQLAVVVRVPRHVPFPVEASPRDFPLVLQRPKRDFGITAAVTASIAIASAAAALLL